uniref:RNA-directed DNA polymerase, putative n=1 Tax=Medicago truncatula TaxID=3880 RepID=Q2HRM1_MEDTR|nr:RNA-directed DNA polymerase, putative [Medicago truncatula]ABD33252.2 RNA-directed DNA polymerase, putative [Medicago truncatula]
MVFCKGKLSSLEALKDLFTIYATCSSQMMNLRKSCIYVGGISNSRLNHIVNLSGFTVSTLPFTYIEASFKGKPKCIHFQPIADKFKAKIANWKASLLSIAGRVQLVKSDVQSMLLHTMSIYSCPIKILRDMEKWIKNFIWSGDVTKRKMVTVAWKKIYAAYDEGVSRAMGNHH